MAETMKVRASHHNTTCNVVATSSTPASSGPMMLAKGALAWMRPLALSRSSWDTRLGIAALVALTKPTVSVELMNVTR